MAAKRRSEEEEAREMEIKRERNRIAFEAWLERKKEEQKVNVQCILINCPVFGGTVPIFGSHL